MVWTWSMRDWRVGGGVLNVKVDDDVDVDQVTENDIHECFETLCEAMRPHNLILIVPLGSDKGRFPLYLSQIRCSVGRQGGREAGGSGEMTVVLAVLIMPSMICRGRAAVTKRPQNDGVLGLGLRLGQMLDTRPNNVTVNCSDRQGG